MLYTISTAEFLKFVTHEGTADNGLCTANMACNFSMVFVDVMEFMIQTSSHFEVASTSTRNIWFFHGPAKSRCSRLHGCLGHSHG